MATLAQTIKQNSRLFTSSEEELQSLAKKQGLPVQATDPLTAQQQGATPSQAAMAGSSANLQAALRNSIRGQENLADAERRATPRKEATLQETLKMKQGQNLGVLGSLDGRVEALIQKQFANPQAQASLKADLTKLPSTLSAEQRSQAEGILNKLGSGTASNEDIVTLNRALGRSVGNMLTGDELKQQYLSTSDSLSKTLAEQTPDNVTIGQLPPAELGVASYEELEGLLGVPSGTVQAMTVAQFEEAIDNVQRTQFRAADDYRRILSDPFASVQEKEEAARLLREAGAVGIKQTEASVEALANAADSWNTVEFAGETYNIQDLLSDENIAGLAKNFIESPEYAERLKKDSPELADWFEENRAALEEATKHIDTRLGEVAAINEENKELANINGVEMSDSVMQQIFPDWNELQASVYSMPPLIRELKQLSASDQASVVGFLNTLAAEEDAAALKDIAGLTWNDFVASGLSTQEGQADFRTYRDTVRALETYDPALEPEALLRDIFGVSEADDLQEMYRQLRWAEKNLGIDVDNDLLDILGPESSFKIRSIPEMAQIAKEKLGNKTLVDAIKQGFSASPQKTLREGSSLIESLKATDPVAGGVLNAMADGNVTPDEVTTLTEQFADNLADLVRLKEISPFKGTIQEAIDRKIDSEMLDMVQASGLAFDDYKAFDKWVNDIANNWSQGKGSQADYQQALSVLSTINKANKGNAIYTRANKLAVALEAAEKKRQQREFDAFGSHVLTA